MSPPGAARGGGRNGGGAETSTLALGKRRASNLASSWDGLGDTLTPASGFSTPR